MLSVHFVDISILFFGISNKKNLQVQTCRFVFFLFEKGNKII